MTKKAKQKAIRDLQAIVSNYAIQSFNQTNKKKDGSYYKTRRPYSLPDEANTANRLIQALSNESLTLDEEIEAKAFLLPYRVRRNEYLVNTDERMR